MVSELQNENGLQIGIAIGGIILVFFGLKKWSEKHQEKVDERWAKFGL